MGAASVGVCVSAYNVASTQGTKEFRELPSYLQDLNSTASLTIKSGTTLAASQILVRSQQVKQEKSTCLTLCPQESCAYLSGV